MDPLHFDTHSMSWPDAKRHYQRIIQALESGGFPGISEPKRLAILAHVRTMLKGEPRPGEATASH